MLRKNVGKALLSLALLVLLPAVAGFGIELLLVRAGALNSMAPWRIILLAAAAALLVSTLLSRRRPGGGADRGSRPGVRAASVEALKVFGPALVLVVMLRSFVVEPFTVPTGSMLPSLEIGDHVFASKSAYAGGRLPGRGDVVVFRYPRDPDQRFIKRAVGLPGDLVAIEEGALVVNGTRVPRCRVGEITYEDRDLATMTWREERGILFLERLGSSIHAVVHSPRIRPGSWGPVRVPDGHVFMMGDNRDWSHDSRSWGGVPRHLLTGRALVIWWSSGPRNRPLRLGRMGHVMGSGPLLAVDPRRLAPCLETLRGEARSGSR